jgi:transposase
MARVEIFRGQARRRWSEEEKRRLVVESLEPGATVHAVAQRHGVNTSQLFTWRQRFRTQPSLPAPPGLLPTFAAVEVAPVQCPSEETEPRPNTMASGGVIEIELPHGRRVRITGGVEPAVVTTALRVLMRR